MHAISDQTSALLGINQAMQKTVLELDRLGLSASHAGNGLERINTSVGRQIVDLQWLIRDVTDWGGLITGGSGGHPAGSRSASTTLGGGGGAQSPQNVFTGHPGPSAGMSSRAPGTIRGLSPEVAWAGLGGKIDPLLSSDSGYAASFFTNKLLKHGGVNPALIAQYNAHLRGGQRMSPSDLAELQAQAAGPSARGPNRHGDDHDALSGGDLKNIAALHDMARHKQLAAHAYKRLRDGTPAAQAQTLAQSSQETETATKAVKAFGETLHDAAQRAKTLFQKGLMFGSVAAQSASPDAFATLSGSFKLLFAQLGTTLLPTVVKLSAYLQGLAHRFEGASEGTKKLVGSLTTWGIAGAGLVALSPQILAFAKMARGAGKFTGINAALSWAGGMAQAHPITAGALALTGGAAAMGWLPHQRVRALTELTDHDVNKSSKEFNAELMRNSPEYKALEAIKDPGERAAAYMKMAQEAASSQRKARRQFEAESGDHNPFEALENPEIRKKLPWYWKAMDASPLIQIWKSPEFRKAAAGFNEDAIKEAKTKLEGAESHQEMVSRIGKELLGGERQKSGTSLLDRKANMAGAAQGLLLDLQSRVQPAYYSVEDIQKKIQLEALSESPLQQEIRRIQQDQLDILLRLADKEFPDLARAIRDSRGP